MMHLSKVGITDGVPTFNKQVESNEVKLSLFQSWSLAADSRWTSIIVYFMSTFSADACVLGAIGNLREIKETTSTSNKKWC